MLLVHLATVFYLSLTFVLRTQQISTSLALILSWLPLLPNELTEFGTYLQSIPHPLDLASPLSSPVSLESKSQPICNSLESGLVLVHGFCSIKDEFILDAPLHDVAPTLAPTLAYPEQRRFQQLSLARSRQLHHFVAYRVWFWVVMVFSLAFLISSISAYPSHIAADMANIDSGENMLELTQNPLSQTDGLLPMISEIVFAAPPVLLQAHSEASSGVLSSCICDTEGNSEHPALPPSPPSAAIFPQISSCGATEQVNLPPTLVASVDISPLSLETCNDRVNSELSPYLSRYLSLQLLP